VEDITSNEATPSITPNSVRSLEEAHSEENVVGKENNPSSHSEVPGDDDGNSSRKRRRRRKGSGTGSSFNSSFDLGNVTDGEDHRRLQDKEVGWAVGDDAKMGLS
jgi:hypothetical protein